MGAQPWHSGGAGLREGLETQLSTQGPRVLGVVVGIQERGHQWILQPRITTLAKKASDPARGSREVVKVSTQVNNHAPPPFLCCSPPGPHLRNHHTVPWARILQQAEAGTASSVSHLTPWGELSPPEL